MFFLPTGGPRSDFPIRLHIAKTHEKIIGEPRVENVQVQFWSQRYGPHVYFSNLSSSRIEEIGRIIRGEIEFQGESTLA